MRLFGSEIFFTKRAAKRAEASPKFCVNCVHYVQRVGDTEELCQRNAAQTLDLVTGGPKWYGPNENARASRETHSRCGKAGRFFVSRS